MPRCFVSIALFVTFTFLLGSTTLASQISDDAAEGFIGTEFDWLLHDDLFQELKTDAGEPGALALVAKAMRDNDPRAGLALQNYLDRYPRDPAAFDLAGTQLLREGQADKAAIALRHALKLNSQAHWTRAKYGAALAMAGQLRAAEQQLLAAIASDPENALALRWLQRIATTKGDLIGATRYAEQSLNAFGLPETRVNQAHLDLADLYIATGRWHDVLSLLAPVLRADQLDVPDSFAAEIFGRLAQAGTEVSNPAMARSALERARELLPAVMFANPPWPVIEARTLLLEGHPDKALELLELFAGNIPGNRRALVMELARAQAATGDISTALANLADAIKNQSLGETTSLAALYREIADEAGWPAGSAEALSDVLSEVSDPFVSLERARAEIQTGHFEIGRSRAEALATSETAPVSARVDSYQLLAGLSHQSGESAQARAYVRAALALAPSNETLWLTLAAYTHDVGAHSHVTGNDGHKELREILVEASIAMPNSSVIWGELGIVDFTSGDVESAAENLLKSLRLSPARPEINLLAALALADSNGDLAIAQSLAEFALRVNPGNPAAMDALGWVISRQGNLSQGIALMTEAISIEPNDETIQYHLGISYLEQGNLEKGRSYLIETLAVSDYKHVVADARAQIVAAFPADEVVATVNRIDADGVHEVLGTITLRQTDQGLSVTADVTGLPAGPNAAHIHERPTCDGGGKLAGPHFGMGHDHGGHEQAASEETGDHDHSTHSHDAIPTAATDTDTHADHSAHMAAKPAGDLDPFVFDANGHSDATVVNAQLTLDQVRARSLMFHEGADVDGKSGGKIACAVIP
jgi:Cu-Zn family superoxide dismutase